MSFDSNEEQDDGFEARLEAKTKQNTIYYDLKYSALARKNGRFLQLHNTHAIQGEKDKLAIKHDERATAKFRRKQKKMYEIRQQKIEDQSDYIFEEKLIKEITDYAADLILDSMVGSTGDAVSERRAFIERGAFIEGTHSLPNLAMKEALHSPSKVRFSNESLNEDTAEIGSTFLTQGFAPVHGLPAIAETSGVKPRRKTQDEINSDLQIAVKTFVTNQNKYNAKEKKENYLLQLSNKPKLKLPVVKSINYRGKSEGFKNAIKDLKAMKLPPIPCLGTKKEDTSKYTGGRTWNTTEYNKNYDSQPEENTDKEKYDEMLLSKKVTKGRRPSSDVQFNKLYKKWLLFKAGKSDVNEMQEIVDMATKTRAFAKTRKKFIVPVIGTLKSVKKFKSLLQSKKV